MKLSILNVPPNAFVISLLILLVGDINIPNLFESVEFSCSPDFVDSYFW